MPVLISRAIEMFMVRLLRDAEQQIEQRNARTLTPQHIKQAIHSHQVKNNFINRGSFDMI